MAGKRRKKHDDHGEAHADERWLITYADMITLLMAFFIMLFAMSQLDLAKFKDFQSGLVSHYGSGTPVQPGGSGHLKGGNSPMFDLPTDDKKGPGGALSQIDKATDPQELHRVAVSAERNALEGARQEIEANLRRHGQLRSVRFQLSQRGLIVTVASDHVLFDLGSAELRPEGRHILDGMAGAFRRLPNDVAIEGHTDNLPIRGRFASNWELSTARASSVVRYLIGTHHVPAGRLGASGYADQHPVARNDTPAHRALNRRVEIVVVSTVDPTAGSAADQAHATTGGESSHE